MIAHAHSMSSSGAVLVTLDGRDLPLRSAALQVDARAGLAAVVLRQRFENPWPQPLNVRYQLPLAHDAAVTGFRFRIGEREIVGEVDRRDRARERYDQALLDGHTAALLEQDRSSLFTQELGNIAPHSAIEVEITIDQPLAWLAEAGGAWELRLPTVVAPRYLGEPGRVADADRVTTATTTSPTPITMSMALTIRDPLARPQPESPSHTLVVSRHHEGEAEAVHVGLAPGGVALDRDIVVRWAVAAPAPGAVIDCARPHAAHARAHQAFATLTVVPPQQPTTAVPRDLIVLLDTSGSMSGAPIAQSQRLATALIDTLGERDRLELLEFSSSVRSFRPEPAAADASTRALAKAWVAGLRASGGTEMRAGILTAMASLRPEAQRQIVLVTDGHIGFEAEIVAAILHQLPNGCRVHTVGVGSSVNRSLTAAAARAGCGAEIIIGIDEDPERAIARLLAHTAAPQIVDLQLDGDALVAVAPARLPDLMASMPATLRLQLRPEGGSLRVRGRSERGTWEQRLQVPPLAAGSGNAAIVSRFARERALDLEARIAAGESARALDHELVELGLAFQIATRLTSWLAVDHVVSVDPTAPVRHELVPQMLPHGMSAEGLGLRPPEALRTLASMIPGAAPMSAAAPSPPPMVVRRMRAPEPVAAGPRAPAPSRPAAPAQESKKQKQERERDQASLGEGGGRQGSGGAARDEDDVVATDEAEFEFASRATEVAPQQLAARLTVAADGSFVFELAAPHSPVQWSVPATIELVLADGRRVLAEVDPARTTAAGSYGAGLRLRLCCRPVAATLREHVTTVCVSPMLWLAIA